MYQNKLFIALIFVINSSVLMFGQVFPDQYWLLGAHEQPAQAGNNNAILRFDSSGLEITEQDMHINFESTVATMVDSSGNLLFYTNGCFVANANGEMMDNGDGLNPGEMHDWTCGTAGYVAPFGAMALAAPAGGRLYYLLHIGVNYSPEHRLTYGPFYYSVVDMDANGGLGKVVSKNNLLVNQRNLAPFSVVRHGNGRDWWVVVPEYGTDAYFKFIIGHTGIQPAETQHIGDALSCRYIGAGAFSRQGHRYARQHHCGVFTYDFDRCTGLFSNARHLPFAPQAFGGGGVIFTPDGNSVLTTTQLAIMRADLTAENPVLDTVIDYAYMTGTSLHLMQYGGDGKLYFSTLGRGAWYHVVEDAGNIDDHTDFKFRGQLLPVKNIRTLPNLPNFRLYDWHESPCDTLGITVSPVVSVPDPGMALYITPNPATTHIQVHYEHIRPEQILLYNMSGECMRVIECDADQKETRIELSDLPPGVYCCAVKDKSGRLVTRTFAHTH